MTEQALRKMIAAGESTRQEFKSWVKCKDYRQRKELAVKSAVALANTKGGVLLFGVEDDGTITGCPKSDPQALMEAIYDMTRPSLFTEIEPVETSDGVVLVVSVEKSNSHVATTGGIYYRRLGNVTKPDYPANDVYSPADNPDFSAKIVEGATESDIDLLEVYRLKEKLRIRDAGSALPDLADTTFLDNLNLIRMDKDEVRVTVAGLLFVGKAASIARLLPQAEVIYLHYSDEAQTEYDNRMDMQEPVISILDKLTERIRTYNRLTNVQVGLFRLEVYDFSEAVFQEALLNALAHRSYEDMAPVYVKHYPTKIVIENPGGFPGGHQRKQHHHPPVHSPEQADRHDPSAPEVCAAFRAGRGHHVPEYAHRGQALPGVCQHAQLRPADPSQHDGKPELRAFYRRDAG